MESFVSCAVDALSKQAPLVKAPPPERMFRGTVEEDAILLLSDTHVGQINWFVDMVTGKGYQTYNREIMVREGNRLVESIANINTLLSHQYKLRKLYVFCLGDLVENDQTFRGQRFFIEMGVGAQLLGAMRFFADIVTSFLSIFEEVELDLVGGNHGRMTARREAAPSTNNFDYLLSQFLSVWFRNEPRVTVFAPESWFFIKEIHGWKYMLHHGNSVYSWMSMPYYGIQRQGKARRTEEEIDVECIGHFHTRMEIPINSRSTTLINGSWIEKSSFSWEKYGVYTKPEQWFFGVSPKRPRTWSFNIDLTVDTSPATKEM